MWHDIKYVCPSVCVPAFMLVCLPALSACLPVSQSACLPVSLSASLCLSVCLSVSHPSAWLPVCLSACLSVSLSANRSSALSSLPVCLSGSCLSICLASRCCVSACMLFCVCLSVREPVCWSSCIPVCGYRAHCQLYSRLYMHIYDCLMEEEKINILILILILLACLISERLSCAACASEFLTVFRIVTTSDNCTQAYCPSCNHFQNKLRKLIWGPFLYLFCATKFSPLCSTLIDCATL